MKNKPKSMRNVLFALIRETAKNASAFVRDPERDFTRKRKLDMETMILILIGMEGIAPPDVLNQYVFHADHVRAFAMRAGYMNRRIAVHVDFRAFACLLILMTLLKMRRIST